MTALKNSGEWEPEKATEESEEMICLYFTPSPTYFPPSPPPILLSSNSMVVHGLSDQSMDNPPLNLRYGNVFDTWPTTFSPPPFLPSPKSTTVHVSQRSIQSNSMGAFTSYKQSMENPPQNQLHEHDDIVELLPPSTAEDWLWLKQETVQYWIAAVHLNQRETSAPHIKRTNKLRIRQGHRDTTMPLVLSNYCDAAPRIKRTNKVYITQGHDGEWMAKLGLGRNWPGISTSNTAKDACDRALIKLKRGKSRLNVHKLLKHKKVAEPTAKSIARIPPPAAQQENPGDKL